MAKSWYSPLDNSRGLTDEDVRPFLTHPNFCWSIGERDHLPGNCIEMLAVEME